MSLFSLTMRIFWISSQQKLHALNIKILLLLKLFSKTQLGCLYSLMDDMYKNIQSDKLFQREFSNIRKRASSLYMDICIKIEGIFLAASQDSHLSLKAAFPSTEISLSENTVDIRCERGRISHPPVQIIPAGCCYCASIIPICCKSSVRPGRVAEIMTLLPTPFWCPGQSHTNWPYIPPGICQLEPQPNPIG